MIALPARVKVWLAAGATDMRNGFDGLAALVQTQLAEDPFSGQLFVFRGKAGDRVSKKSELAKAIRYALSNWAALTRYGEDGRLEIDNNTAERALRAVALGARTGSLQDPMTAASAPRQSTRSSVLQNSTLSIPKAPALRPRAHRRSSHQPNRRAAALESTPKDPAAAHRSVISPSMRPSADGYAESDVSAI